MRTRAELRADIRSLEQVRSEAIERWLAENYYPQLGRLQMECGKLGHEKRKTWSNMFCTREWDECVHCGAHYNHRDI